MMLNIEMSHEEFVASHFEKQPLLFTGILNERPLQWPDLDQLLHGMESDERLVQMFLNGQLAPQNYMDEVFELGRQRKRINKHRFYEFLHNGATLVLNRFEDFSVVGKRLCAEIGRFAQQPTTSNAYVSFSGSGTFGQHWDTHDVFAIQLIGRKLWKLFSPTLPLPTSQQTSRLSQHECPATPAFEFMLDAGDVLYIPRGWWHEVVPQDIASLHLSVGTYPPTVLDYFKWVCNRQLPQFEIARKGISDLSNMTPTIKNVMQLAMAEALDEKNIQAFTHQLRSREHLTSEFLTEFMVDKADKNIADTCQISLNSCYKVAANEKQLPVNGGQLTLSDVGKDIVDLLTRKGSLSWTQLCDELTDDNSVTLHDAVLDLTRYEVINITDY